MDRKKILLGHLSNGHFYSGQSLAKLLNISRTAVWKYIKALERDGLDIYAVRGKGYRLSRPVELLNENQITSKIDLPVKQYLRSLTLLMEINSTNEYMWCKSSAEGFHGDVVISEYQSQGRGRRGNTWVSPLASGIYLSIGWHFDASPASLNALSLACGVAVITALKRLNINDVNLKWPNDILHYGHKLGGILVESRIETAGTCDVVIGLGMNTNLPHEIKNNIDQPVTDIEDVSNHKISRNELTAILVSELLSMFASYAGAGFSAFVDIWRQNDALLGKQAILKLPDRSIQGNVLGIDNNGLLVMSVDNKTMKFSSGDLSVRELA